MLSVMTTPTNASAALGLRVRQAILAAPSDVYAVAKATGLTTSDVNARLDGRAQFTAPELVMVGGLLRVSPVDLLEGIA